MRIAALSAVVVSLILATASAEGQESRDVQPLLVRQTFDVEVDKVLILHSDQLSEFQIINCRFTIDDFRTAPDSYASVALILTSSDPQHYDYRSYMARVAAYRFEEDDGWAYEFTLTNPEDRDSIIVAHTGKTDSVLPLWLTYEYNPKDHYPKVYFFVGDKEIDNSMVDVSNYPLESWQVIAVGVEGESLCTIVS